jgi:hypothetical protein
MCSRKRKGSRQEKLEKTGCEKEIPQSFRSLFLGRRCL